MRTLVHITADALPSRDGACLDALGASLGALVRDGHEIVITCAGPAEAAAANGARLVRALSQVLPGRTVTALVTHAAVRAHDPALRLPAERPPGTPDPGTKPLAALRPHAVLEAAAVRDLLAGGSVPVCAGGGIPVIREPGTDRWRAVPGDVDPERTAVLLAAYLDTDTLLFLTSATHLFARRGRGRTRPLLHVTAAELPGLRLAESARALAGAAADYVLDTGGTAAVGPADNALGIVRGTTGTLVRPTPAAPLDRQGAGVPGNEGLMAPVGPAHRG